jgi:hypothetical protein
LSHLINISPVRQIRTASCCEAQGGYRDRISKGSALYRVRSRGGCEGMGQVGMETATGSKTGRAALFLTRIIKATIERGRGRVFGPVEVWVSALDTTVVGREMLNDCTY